MSSKILSKVANRISKGSRAETGKEKAEAYASAIGFILGDALSVKESSLQPIIKRSANSALQVNIPKTLPARVSTARINSASSSKHRGADLDKVEAEREALMKAKHVKNRKVSNKFLGMPSTDGSAFGVGKAAMVSLLTVIAEKALVGPVGFVLKKLWSVTKWIGGKLTSLVSAISTKLWAVIKSAGSMLKNAAVSLGSRGVSAARGLGAAAVRLGGMTMGGLAAGGAGTLAAGATAVAGAGYLGYKAGGWLNDKMNEGISSLSDGEYSSLGDVIYELVNGTELKEKIAAWGSEQWTAITDKVQSFVGEYVLDPLKNWFTKTVPDWFNDLTGNMSKFMEDGFKYVKSAVSGFVSKYVINGVIDWWNGIVQSDTYFGKAMRGLGIEGMTPVDVENSDSARKAFEASGAALGKTAIAPYAAVGSAVLSGAKAVGESVSSGVDAGISKTKDFIDAGNVKLDNVVASVSGKSIDQAAADQASGANASLASIMNMIGQHESGNDYNRVVGEKRGAFPDLTDMTIGELVEFQSGRIRAGKNSASGRWQINKETLLDFYNKAGLTMSSKFSQENQDKLFMALLDRRGMYTKYKNGEASKDELANDIAKTWASMPKEDGRSHYAGVGNNKALTSRSDVMSAIPAAAALTASPSSNTSGPSGNSESVTSTTLPSPPLAAAPSKQKSMERGSTTPSEPRVPSPISSFLERDLFYTMA